jgi:N-acetylglucosamine kinase-like BadF-type ATPase
MGYTTILNTAGSAHVKPPLTLGIDGGGTGLRVAVCDGEMTVVAMHTGDKVNPNAVGHEVSRERLQGAVRAALAAAGVGASALTAAGVGIAGAAPEHARDWLESVFRPVLGDTPRVYGSDVEIALVGARGERFGALVLAGTGSAAFGVSRAGTGLLVGGWGYLLGDEGSGYWLGTEAMRVVTVRADRGEAARSPLATLILRALSLKDSRDLIAWRYDPAPQRIAQVASLAPLVFAAANAGDRDAARIIDHAASHLAGMAGLLRARLHEPDLPIAFGGGLLTAGTPLAARLAALLQLAEPPAPRYPPVVGAALMARLNAGG